MNSDNTEIIEIKETDSTNRFLKDYHADKRCDMLVAVTRYQSAGKGQGTNMWESEPGKNLLFSILIHPENIRVNRQFVLSMAISLTIKEVLDGYTDNISIKWPNDIYYKNKKICGILIENNLRGNTIKDCILGIGINVNQDKFISDAPNPVSLIQITGEKTDVHNILNMVIERFRKYVALLYKGEYEDIKKQYLSSLYRSEGCFRYHDATGYFNAKIDTVEDDGHLVLIKDGGIISKYGFKE